MELQHTVNQPVDNSLPVNFGLELTGFQLLRSDASGHRPVVLHFLAVPKTKYIISANAYTKKVYGKKEAPKLTLGKRNCHRGRFLYNP